MRRGAGEDGVYIVLYAVLAVGLFAMAAVVLDVAAFRQDRRQDRLVADLAATAGAADLDPSDPSGVAACTTTWGYVQANLPALASAPAPDCTALAGSCDPNTRRTATVAAAPFTVEISHPVPDADPLMLTEAPSGDRPQAITSADGSPCQRLGLRLVRVRQTRFGQVAGFSGGATDVHAVARAALDPRNEPPAAIVVLERTGCGALRSSDDPGGGLLVSGVSGGPGVVEVDSDGSTCGAGDYVVRAPVAALIANPGAPPALISSYAMSTNAARAYNPADVAAGRLAPNPVPAAARVGRALADARYNDGPSSPIAQLRASAAGPAPPTGHVPVTTCTPTSDVVYTTAVFVDCPGGFSVPAAVNVTFLGTSTIFAGPVRIESGGCLAVNSAACIPGPAPFVPPQDSVVFLRSGSLVKDPNGRLILERTFVHTAGAVDMSPDESGSKELRWVAPLGGPYEDLALWTESTAPVGLGGHGTFQLEGVFVAPNTTDFLLRARTGGSVANAQVLARNVRSAGGHPFRVVPLTGRALTPLQRGVRLVR